MAFASVQLWIFAQPKQHGGLLIQAIMSPDQVSRGAVEAVTACNINLYFTTYFYLLGFGSFMNTGGQINQ